MEFNLIKEDLGYFSIEPKPSKEYLHL